ncbi:uncharacterized protein PAC_09750 [Phialocephala subalpina]|uniref:Uncharacterized protein n=1 Tax=Phialocephala subalpina TaxID=576137 RepID=A0A1L7X4A2_9HELO|nr:uncharacterized protein PAC_09750 [Phialocephala subalpina]
MFFALKRNLPPEIALHKTYTNTLGHTVLDTLMITVLKSHTRTSPSLVDQALAKETSFKGEEADICGRWDADSECYRALVANGESSVPFEWKHKFCGTAIQVICHSIGFLDFAGANFNSPSGLFLRYCTGCGKKLQLRPLHTLVLVAFQLAQSGCGGEDLFGALACLLQLLSGVANPLLSADISLSALLGQAVHGICDHEELQPSDLAQRVSPEIVSQWSSAARSGWRVFCWVLRHAQNTWTMVGEDEEDDDSLRWNTSADIDDQFESDCHLHQDDDVPPSFGSSIYLGHIWAAIQVEFLSYRRLTESDPWLSENISMESLLRSLETGIEISIGYLEHGMLLPYCRCGFPSGDLYLGFFRQEFLTDNISNMDDNSRCTLIQDPWGI